MAVPLVYYRSWAVKQTSSSSTNCTYPVWDLTSHIPPAVPVAPKISPADQFYDHFVAIRNSEITPSNEPLRNTNPQARICFEGLGHAFCPNTELQMNR
jgi:hypothetical protein